MVPLQITCLCEPLPAMLACVDFCQLYNVFYQKSVASVDAYRQNVFQFAVRVHSVQYVSLSSLFSPGFYGSLGLFGSLGSLGSLSSLSSLS